MTRNDYEEDDVGEAGERIPRHHKEQGALAREAIEAPGLLSNDLLRWLCSPEAEKAHVFFHLLGRHDSGKKWLPGVEQLGAADVGALPFAYYFWGLSEHDCPFVDKRLDELIDTHNVTDVAIVRTTGLMGGSSAAVKRLEALVWEKRVSPPVVERLLFGRWVEPLSPGDFLHLLKTLAGPDPRRPVCSPKSTSITTTFWSRCASDLPEPFSDCNSLQGRVWRAGCLDG